VVGDGTTAGTAGGTADERPAAAAEGGGAKPWKPDISQALIDSAGPGTAAVGADVDAAAAGRAPVGRGALDDDDDELGGAARAARCERSRRCSSSRRRHNADVAQTCACTGAREHAHVHTIHSRTEHPDTHALTHARTHARTHAHLELLLLHAARRVDAQTRQVRPQFLDRE
jgi:hypothetical protein